MKGLLLKDFYMAAKYCRMHVVIAAIFMILSVMKTDMIFFALYPCMLASSVPVNLLAYDERSKWNDYLGTLPYQSEQIVSSKYLLSLILQAVLIVLTLLMQAARMLQSGGVQWNILLMIALLLIVAGCAASFTLPFIFRFGVEKGRIAYYVMIGAFCGISTAVDFQLPTSISLRSLLLIICAAVVVLYLIAWRLSIIFYRKKTA